MHVRYRQQTVTHPDNIALLVEDGTATSAMAQSHCTNPPEFPELMAASISKLCSSSKRIPNLNSNKLLSQKVLDFLVSKCCDSRDHTTCDAHIVTTLTLSIHTREAYNHGVADDHHIVIKLGNALLDVERWQVL